MQIENSDRVGKRTAAGLPTGWRAWVSRMRAHHFLLAAPILWVFGTNLVWTMLDTRPPAWDQSRHLYLVIKYWSVLTSGSDHLWQDLLNVEMFYPPFYHLSLFPFLNGFGFSADNVVLVNSLYLAVLILSTYGIGRVLYDRDTGLLAAFLISCYPFLIYISRQCLTETMLTAVIASAYYFFFRCENFENRKFSFLFSCAFTVGMMVKWTTLIYLLPAVVIGLLGNRPESLRKQMMQIGYYLGLIAAIMILPLITFILNGWNWIPLLLEFALIYFLIRWKPATGLSSGKITNLVALAGIPIVICFPWYAHNLMKMSRGAVKSFLSGIYEGDPYQGLEIWLYYPKILPYYFGFPLLLLLIAALLWFLTRKRDFNIGLFGWVAVPYVFFSLVTNKDPRYPMCILPALAVISAVIVFRIPPGALRRSCVSLIVLAGLVTSVSSGFFLNKVKAPFSDWTLFGANDPPRAEHWPHDEILNDIIADGSPLPGETITLRTLTNHVSYQRGLFRNTAAVRGLPVNLRSVKRSLGEMTDYFITKDGGIGPPLSQADINPKKKRLLNEPALTRTFTLFRSYPLPDGANGLVLKRDVSPARDVAGVDDLSQVEKRLIQALSRYPMYGISDGINMSVTVVPTGNPEDIYLGRYKRIEVRADSAVINKIRLHDFELVFDEVQINLYDLFWNGNLILFELKRIFPRGTIRFEELEATVEKELKGRGSVRLQGEQDRLVLKARLTQSGFAVEADAAVRLIFEPGKSIRPQVESLVVGPIAVREIFYRRIVDEQISLNPTPGWPLETDIRSIDIFPRRLEVNQSLQ